MEVEWIRALLTQRIKITLVCGTYSGCLRHVDAANKTVVLDQVEDLENKRKLPGVKMFFGYEIKNLEILDALPTGSENKPTNVNHGKLEETNPEKVFRGKHFSELEDENLEYIVIDQFHQKFGPAIFHIKQQSVIGIAVEGIDVCRFGKLCWIQIATKDQIYLFDIFLLGAVAFKNGLKMVLEDTNILKVIHDCRLVSDCLYHQYGVDLTNVFDTQVNPKVWTCRPLPTRLMQSAVLEVMYLLSLRSALMDKLMLDFTTQVDNYLSMYRNMPSITLGCTESGSAITESNTLESSTDLLSAESYSGISAPTPARV